MRNHFVSESVAARYARGRPEFHAGIVESLRARVEERQLITALDVGCGTGFSTRPLSRLARRAVGLDPSLAMLAHARRAPRTHYVAAWAEALPFRTGSIDLLTVSQVFHWLDRERFFTEALRILGPTGFLVVYDNFFAGETEDGEVEGLRQWMRDIYWRRYPYPPRFSVDFTPGENADPGFRCETCDEYQNVVAFTRERLVDYLVTQTNMIAAVEEGEKDLEEMRGWLSGELTPFFDDRESRSFVFEGPIWILRPNE